MDNYPNYYSSQAVADKTSAVMKLVYIKMAFALVITGLTAYLLAYTGSSNPMVLSPYNQYIFTHQWTMWAIIIAQFALVIGINAAINKMSSATATLLFLLFSVVMGLWTTPLFAVYTHTSIAKTFFITAGTFGAMSIYGYTTKADLSKFGSILFMALIGLIIASLVNIFLKSSTMGWIISIAGVLIFTGLTAWDTQTIKQMAANATGETVGRIATIGALSLYLDFINLFLFLLRFFGNSRD